MQPFVHLSIHSVYSLCEGVLPVEKIVGLCEQFSMPAVAITDANNLFGALEFSTKASAHGIQPIVGARINLCYKGRKENTERIRVYAQNEHGYFNLMQLVTSSHIEPYIVDFPSISIETLSKYSDDLIILTGGDLSTFNQLLLANKKDLAVEYISELSSIFCDRVYIEIQRHNLAEEKEIEGDLLNIAYDKNIPIVATNNVCFPSDDYKEAHEVLLCIGAGTTIEDPSSPKSNSQYYFKSSEEMQRLFEDIPEAYNNTSVIAQRCSFMIIPRKPLMPEVKTENGRTQDEQLRKMSIDGLEKRLDVFREKPDFVDIKKRYYERLEYELDMIKKMGFSGYFLIICDYVQWAKTHNIPVGPGRGSGAGSLVAYALTITNVDPLRFKLFFERFLNPERVSMPDVDIDFCQARRGEVIQYVQDHYGKDSVAQIITFGKLQARAAIKDVGRAMGLSYSMTDRIAKLIPFVPTKPVTLAEAIKQEPLLKQEIEKDYQVQHLVEVALKLEGMCKNTSVHAAGIVITDKIIRNIVALYKDPKATMPVTQFSMKYIESTGLIKFDFLGLKTLTVIQETINFINAKGIKFAIDTIPLDDKRTFDLLKNIDCVGIFQLESGGMRDVIKKLRPDKIEDIIALVALYRPGPMDDIPRYIACKHGEEKIRYLDPRLEPILAETYGIMVYQEQVMQIAQVIGGYTLGQADILRRAMGKKQHDEMARQKVKFIEGAVKNGVSESVANTLFDLMSKFASYGFNKSHSTPYGLITYQTAYLKANYTIEFYAAIMTLDMDSTDKIHTYYNDIRTHQIGIIPPAINRSCEDFTIDYEKNAIIYSLSALKGSGKPAVHAIEEERNTRGDFKSIFDFIERMKKYNVVNRKLLDCFIKAGVFDSLCPNRKQMFQSIDLLLTIGDDADQGMLFEKCYPDLPNVADWTVAEKLEGELEAIGFYISAHPLDEFADVLAKNSVISIGESSHHDHARIAGVVLSNQRKTTKNGSKFMILDISDKSGTADVMVFSELLESKFDILTVGNMLLIEANISKDGEYTRYTATEIYRLTPELTLQKISYGHRIDPILESTTTVFISIHAQEDLKKVQNVLSDCKPGNMKVRLNIMSENKKIDIRDRFNISIREFLNMQNALGTKNISHD